MALQDSSQPAALLGALLLASCSSTGESQERDATRPGARRPNVVLIVTDDQGFGDLSMSGHPTLRTPRIDSLAARGRRLTQFYVASPVCSPSRAAILTGCYPRRVEMHKHVVFPEYDYGLHPDEETIADMLQSAGYRTACFGKWHLGHRRNMLPTDQGFDEWMGIPYSNDMTRVHRGSDDNYGYRLPLLKGEEVMEWEPDQRRFTQMFTDEAVRFIADAKDAPFFLYVPHPMPHVPLYPGQESQGQSPRGIYGDVIEELDQSVGRIEDALIASGVREDTLLIFTSDNGPWAVQQLHGGSAGPLRGAKGTNWEGGQRVPMVVSWPTRVAPGGLEADIFTAMDLLPTLASICRVKRTKNHAIDGEVLVDTLLGSVDDHRGRESGGRKAPFLYYTSNGELAGVRRGPWKLLLNGPKLFHVEHDVSEKFNRADARPELVAELNELCRKLASDVESGARHHLVTDDKLFHPERVNRGADASE